MNSLTHGTGHVAELLAVLDSLLAIACRPLDVGLGARHLSAAIPEPGNLHDNLSLLTVALNRVTHGQGGAGFQLLRTFREHIGRTRDLKGAGVLLALVREIETEVYAHA
jgi:hypothetical protein